MKKIMILSSLYTAPEQCINSSGLGEKIPLGWEPLHYMVLSISFARVLLYCSPRVYCVDNIIY